MLVLSRKIGQSVVVDENIVITVLDAGGGRVALGIQAPKEKAIYRQELYDAMQTTLTSEPLAARGMCTVG